METVGLLACGWSLVLFLRSFSSARYFLGCDWVSGTGNMAKNMDTMVCWQVMMLVKTMVEMRVSDFSIARWDVETEMCRREEGWKVLLKRAENGKGVQGGFGIYIHSARLCVGVLPPVFADVLSFNHECAWYKSIGQTKTLFACCTNVKLNLFVLHKLS